MSHSIRRKDWPEITDCLVDFDADTLQRRPVSQVALVERFQEMGAHRAARIVAQLPARDGILDAEAIDRILVDVHYELQVLSEEFEHGLRVQELLLPFLETLRRNGFQPPLRVVDIGCGTGYVLRWLAAHADRLPGVELIGAEYNVALVREAQRLADREGLPCSFVVANAFRLEQPAHLLMSTGVVHHFRGPALVDFLRQHQQSGVAAFLHFDFQPSIFAFPGAWMFHAIRMRQALSRFDGVLSAVRAHSGPVLLDAVRQGAPDYGASIYGARVWKLPIPRVFHTLVGLQRRLWPDFRRALGRRASRLGPLC